MAAKNKKKFKIDANIVNKIVAETIRDVRLPESLKTKQQYISFITNLAVSSASRYAAYNKFSKQDTNAFKSVIAKAIYPHAEKVVNDAFESYDREKEANDKKANKYNNSHAISAHRFLNEIEGMSELNDGMVKAMLHISRLFILSDIIDTDLRTINEVLAKNHCRLNHNTKQFSQRLQNELAKLKFMVQDFSRQLTGASNSEQTENIEDCDFIDSLTMLALDRTAGDGEARDKVLRSVQRLKSKSGFIGKYIKI